MAKNGSTQESAKVESLIVDTLLKGEDVVIPDIGHLELKSLVGRRTVLFKSVGSDDKFLKVMSVAGAKGKKDADSLYAVLTLPLKEGKTINLPMVGVFRPVKRENGETHVSFMLSSYLRDKLNNITEEKKDVEDVKKVKSEEVEVSREINKVEAVPDAQENKSETQKSELILSKTDKVENYRRTEPAKTEYLSKDRKFPENSNLSDTQKSVQINKGFDRHSSVTKKSPWWRTAAGILLIVAACILFVVFVVMTVTSSKDKDINHVEERYTEAILPSESVNLPALAEQNYGHPAFWIYIYEANKDKLKSPINIPKNVSLVIPDLKNEYDVDVTDSMEIKRANILTDIILKRKK